MAPPYSYNAAAIGSGVRPGRWEVLEWGEGGDGKVEVWTGGDGRCT